MSKKHFIALADAIREHNESVKRNPSPDYHEFSLWHLQTLADFCQSQNPQFMRGRWLGYIAGTCGKNGGAR